MHLKNGQVPLSSVKLRFLLFVWKPIFVVMSIKPTNGFSGSSTWWGNFEPPPSSTYSCFY